VLWRFRTNPESFLTTSSVLRTYRDFENRGTINRYRACAPVTGLLSIRKKIACQISSGTTVRPHNICTRDLPQKTSRSALLYERLIRNELPSLSVGNRHPPGATKLPPSLARRDIRNRFERIQPQVGGTQFVRTIRKAQRSARDRFSSRLTRARGKPLKIKPVDLYLKRRLNTSRLRSTSFAIHLLSSLQPR